VRHIIAKTGGKENSINEIFAIFWSQIGRVKEREEQFASILLVSQERSALSG
jgi:hypothetical protein